MVPERARTFGPPAFRSVAWVLSLAAHAGAAALLLGAPMQVRPEQEGPVETVEVSFAVAPSPPEEANAAPVEAESSAPMRLPPAPEQPAPPQAEAAPPPSPVNEPAAPLSAPPPEPDPQTPPAPQPTDQPLTDPVVLRAPPQAVAVPLSPAAPPPVAPTTHPPRHLAPRPSPPKLAQRRQVAPGSAPAAGDESAAASPVPGQASAPPAAPAASAPSAAGPPVIDPSWRGELGAWMQSHRRYPDAARQRGEEGTVGVAFTVARDGSVLAVQVVRPSGSALLDQAVHDMLAGQKVPAFPPGMAETQARIAVNIRFSLER